MAEITLPPISDLSSAPESTIVSMLDLLFEPSPEIHRLAIPVVRGKQPPIPVLANPGLTAEMGNTSTPFSNQPSPPTGAPAAPPFKSTTVPAPASPAAYASYPDLIRSIGTQMLALVAAQTDSDSDDSADSRSRLHSILGSHPRLGAKKVDSALSRAEQAQLQQSQPRQLGGGGGETETETEAEALARLNAEYEATFPGLRYVVFVNGRGRGVIMDNMRARIDRGDMRAEEREGVTAMIDIALDRAGKIMAAAA
ncbi:OHCU decarboxylase [Microdochium nivale]|nr:OHCU decarboxylase [Microdochium nivale]